MDNMENTVDQVLSECDAVITGDHFVYKAGNHGSVYVNKDAIYVNPTATQKIAITMAVRIAAIAKVNGYEIDMVAGAAVGGAILGNTIAFYLGQQLGKEIKSVFADKEGDSFIFKRGYEKLVPGSSIVVVEDIVNTGATCRELNQVIQKLGGKVLLAYCICNRGGVVGSDIFPNSDISLVALKNIKLEQYPEDNCPLCRQEIPINTKLGHGKAFLQKKGILV